MPETQGRDPDMAGAVRGAALIAVVGVALGIAYNAAGLASRPRHGLAWIKQEEKVQSLEAMQSPAPAASDATSPGAQSTTPQATGDAVAAPAPE